MREPEDQRNKQGLPSYTLRSDTLEYGASFGNAHCWLTTRGGGSIQQLFSVDAGRAVLGSVTIAYGGVGHHFLRAGSRHAAQLHADTDVQLPPVGVGTIELHPAYQRRFFQLSEGLRVQETVFVPVTSRGDPALAYYAIEIANDATSTRSLDVFGFARLGGAFGANITARYDAESNALVGHSSDDRNAVRVFGVTEAVSAYETNLDYGRVYDVYHVSRLRNDTSASGDILGALQVPVHIEPGEVRRVTFLAAYSGQGERTALRILQGALDAREMLDATIAFIARIAKLAQVMTPNATINQGVLWSKVNMLRVTACYPDCDAFTNEPGVSSNVNVS